MRFQSCGVDIASISNSMAMAGGSTVVSGYKDYGYNDLLGDDDILALHEPLSTTVMLPCYLDVFSTTVVSGSSKTST
jgi:hypothetical protein